MIIKKSRICKQCKKDKFIFSKGLCVYCYGNVFGKKIKVNRKPITKSPKQTQRLAKYLELRKEYLKEHPNCEICGVPSDIIHHKSGRIGENLFKNFLTVCDNDHKWIHANPKEAKEKRYLL